MNGFSSARLRTPARRRIRAALATMLALAAASWAHGHGGVVEEDDLCLIRIGFLEAHFTIFQPDVHGHDEFCEDVPEPGNTIFVMDYEHDALRRAELELRIIRDVTGQGRFANRDDIAAIGDLDPVTVYYSPPQVRPIPALAVLLRFEEPGEFIGIVTASLDGKTYDAVFPFAVGATGFGFAPWFIGAIVLLQLGYWLGTGGLNRLRQRRLRARGRAGIAIALVAAAGLTLIVDLHAASEDASTRRVASEHGRFLVVATPDAEPPPLNQMHAWTVAVTHADGRPVNDAQITVAGGMPTHDHGLPTAPRVTERLGDGRYRIEGVRFHMPGAWRITLSIRDRATTDTVAIDFEV